MNAQYAYNPQFANNRIMVNPVTGAGMTYDAAGNLTNDGSQSFTYDATGQQTYASATGLTQSYDGDTLRVKKVENGATTYYLRSSVLGGQVIAELNGSGGWTRGYVYLGGQMLAIQSGGVNWVHQDPVTKSQRVTNSVGTVISTIDLDPWGGETGRSSNQAFQPHRYTSYTRDGNGGDDAMMRRYQSNWSRFSQPDPYDGSYSLTDPQSFNRYAYVQNDPVNFVDPTGLQMAAMCGAEFSFHDCGGGGGFWGGGGGFGGHVAEYNREYGGMTSNMVNGLRTHNERMSNAQGGNGYRTSAEVIRNLIFQIGYWLYSDGSVETNFAIGVTIGNPSPVLFGGSLDRWPPQWPRNRTFGWPEPRSSAPPRVVGPGGQPINTTPTTGTPGIEVNPRYLHQPRINPGNPQIPANLSAWQKIIFWIGAGARAIGNAVGNRVTPIVVPNPALFGCHADPSNPLCRGSSGRPL